MTEGFVHLRDEHANQRVFADFKATLLSSWDNGTAAAWRRRVSVLNKPCIATYKSSEKGAPAQCAYINKRLAGVRREPHRLHQAEVEHAQCKATDHVGQVLFAQQHPWQAHQEGPQHQQDAQRHRQDQVGQQELGDHGSPAGMSGGEGINVHGDVVQEAGRHLPGSPALHQSLDTSYGHDVHDESCQGGNTRGVNQHLQQNVIKSEPSWGRLFSR